MDIATLKTLVGEPYCECDEDGNYIGCFAPLYFLYNDLPRYPLPELESDYFSTALDGLLSGFSLVEGDLYNVLKPLSVIVFRLPMGVLHVGVYLGNNQILHVERGKRVEITRLSRLSHRVFAVLERMI